MANDIQPKKTLADIAKSRVGTVPEKKSLKEIALTRLKAKDDFVGASKQEAYDKATQLGIVPGGFDMLSPEALDSVKKVRENKIKDEYFKNQKAIEETGELPKVGAGEQFKRIISEPERIPFAGMAFDVDNAARYIGILNKLERGKEVPQTDLMELANLASYMSRDKTGFAKALDIAAQSLTFGTEIGASALAEVGTAGVATPAVAAGATARAGAKTLMKQLFNKLVLEGGKDVVEGAVKKAIKEKGMSTVVKEIGKDVAVGGAQAMVRQSPRAVAQTIRDLTPQVDWSTVDKTEEGKFTAEVIKEDKSPAYELLKNVVSSGIEGASERFGRFALPVSVAGKNQLAKSAVGSAILKANDAVNSTEVMKVLNATLQKIGWDGLIPEIGEEYVASTMHGVATELGIDDAGWQFPAPEDLLPMLGGFGAISTIAAGINKYGEYKDEEALKMATKTFEDLQKMVQNDSVAPEQVDRVLDEVGLSEIEKQAVMYDKDLFTLPEEARVLIEAPESPKLLEAPKESKTPAEIKGEGFTMTNKVSKEKTEAMKAVNAFRTEVAKFNKKPTATQLKKVWKARTEMNTLVENVPPELPPVTSKKKSVEIKTPVTETKPEEKSTVGITSAREGFTPDVTERTKEEISKSFKEAGITPTKFETDTYGLYFGEPEPSYSLEIDSNDIDKALPILRDFANKYEQDSFIITRNPKENEKGSPRIDFKFPENLNREQIDSIQKTFNDQGIGLTINAKTGVAYSLNINEFDGLDPQSFETKAIQAISSLPSDISVDWSIASNSVDVYYRSDDYERKSTRTIPGEGKETQPTEPEGKQGTDTEGINGGVRNETKTTEPVTSPEKESEKPQKEVIDGEKKTSKIAKSIETKAIESKLTEGFLDLAGYDPITIKEQSEKVTELINSDFERARRIVKGEEKIPSDIKGISLITGMEEYLANNIEKNLDGVLAQEIANSPLVSETSEAAQTMRLAQERKQDSATARLNEVKAKREADASRATKKKKSAILKEAKDSMDAINLLEKDLSWNKFLDDITC